MEQIWETSNRKVTLDLSIKCQGTCRFKVIAEDLKPNSKYVWRSITVEGYRTIELKFPVSPKKVKITVTAESGSDSDFIVAIDERELETYNVFLDKSVNTFLDVCVPFSQVAGFTNPPPGGRLFTSPGGEFNIKFYPVIKDHLSGKVLNTPARIGHKTGLIETSKFKFNSYTIPMRMIILLHEFSHKYKNPNIGLPISHESGADINALYIYLGLGFSKVDAIYVFANVFLSAQSEGNIRRMRKIVEYIDKFERQEFAYLN
jgi:hypothetical protein